MCSSDLDPFVSNSIDKEDSEIKIRTYDGVIGAPEDNSDCQNYERAYDLQESKFEQYFEFEDPP